MAVSAPRRALNAFVCHACRQRLLAPSRRPFSQTASVSQDGQTPTGLGGLVEELRQARTPSNTPRNTSGMSFSEILDAGPRSFLTDITDGEPIKPHRLHVYAHKHNTHLTLVQPPRSAADTASSRLAGAKVTAAEQKKVVDVLMSISTGNIGFRKAGRGSYDAAFQMAAFALKQIQEKGMLRDMKQLEVVLRGFGAGREAVTKALLGTEGRFVRGKITAVVDATRLKHGGSRGKKPRRLG